MARRKRAMPPQMESGWQAPGRFR